MSRLVKEKLNANVQVNFNKSQEVAYWAKKYNISQEILQQVFADGIEIHRHEFVGRHDAAFGNARWICEMFF